MKKIRSLCENNKKMFLLQHDVYYRVGLHDELNSYHQVLEKKNFIPTTK